MATDMKIPAYSAETGLGDPIYARVREHLRKDILAGVYQVGERLKIQELSRRYGVSPMPVREALQKLEGEGLVQIEPNRGARVRRVDLRFIHNMYDIRAAIDGMLVRKATERITSPTLEELKTAAESYEQAVADEDIAASFEANRRLHEIIHKTAKNEDAQAILSQRWGLIECLRTAFRSGPERMQQAVEEHRRLLDALEKRDADEAERIAKDHCEHARVDLIKQMQKAYGLNS